jgi:hypothetical protein
LVPVSDVNADHNPPEEKEGLALGRSKLSVQAISSSKWQPSLAVEGIRNGLCSESKATGIPAEHHMPRENPPIETARRVASVGFVETFVGAGLMICFASPVRTQMFCSGDVRRTPPKQGRRLPRPCSGRGQLPLDAGLPVQPGEAGKRTCPRSRVWFDPSFRVHVLSGPIFKMCAAGGTASGKATSARIKYRR